MRSSNREQTRQMDEWAIGSRIECEWRVQALGQAFLNSSILQAIQGTDFGSNASILTDRKVGKPGVAG